MNLVAGVIYIFGLYWIDLASGLKCLKFKSENYKFNKTTRLKQ